MDGFWIISPDGEMARLVEVYVMHSGIEADKRARSAVCRSEGRIGRYYEDN